MADVKSQPDENFYSGGFRFKYVFMIIIVLLLILSVFSFSPDDKNVLDGGSGGAVMNWVGPTGAFISYYLFILLGVAVYPVVLFLIVCSVRPFFPAPVHRKGYWGAVLAVVLGITMIFAIYPKDFCQRAEMLGLGSVSSPESSLSGGVLGQQLMGPASQSWRGGIIRRCIGEIGSLTVALAFLLTGLFFVFMADWKIIFVYMITKSFGREEEDIPDPRKASRKRAEAGGPPKTPEEAAKLQAEQDEKMENAVRVLRTERPELTPSRQEPASAPKASAPAPAPEPEKTPEKEERKAAPPPAPKEELREKIFGRDDADGDDGDDDDQVFVNMKPHAPQAARPPPPVRRAEPKPLAEFVMPPSSMLEKEKESAAAGAEDLEFIENQKRVLQATLESFDIRGMVAGVISGPRVNRYEITLEPGVKVEKVTSIANNIAMELEAESIRILAPIPGQNALGVEAPKKKQTAVYLRAMMESDEWKKSPAEIPVILGKNIGGKPVIMDLARAPHLLIAGSTGSGKSVCMNTLIMSLLFKFRPDELRMILVDPKVVEMEMYSTLPHLITPVVSDPKKIPVALRWAVSEMERRYRLLAKVKTKNLAGFNSRMPAKEPVLDDAGEPVPDKLPITVIIVDELADVMMTEAKSEVETSIARIAQKGRAAGIHIVIATQRPSTNIITGVIKANLPTRIAFKVTSIVDSRVILDQKGAETLLGRGDMLFVPPGGASIDRIQGAMVDDRDILKVVEFVSQQAPQQFNDSVLVDGDDDEAGVEDDGAPPFDEDDDGGDSGDFNDRDGSALAAIRPIVTRYLQPGDGDLIRKSLEITLLERKVSTSYLQRRLGIGYNKAAEIVDTFEKRGIVSQPLPGGQKREILVFDEIDGGK